MKLELGSGYHPTEGFLHLDANRHCPSLDFVGSAHPLPLKVRAMALEFNGFDELRAVDVLEHLSYRDTVTALKDWASVTRPGGSLYVQVPDAGAIMESYDEPDGLGRVNLLDRIPPELPQTALMGAAWRLLGGHLDEDLARTGDDFRLNAHFALFDEDHLRWCLDQAGWDIQECYTNSHPNLCCTAVKR